MAPYNTPDESEFPGAPIVVDDEQLRWIVTERLTGPQSTDRGIDAVIDAICLDDSALRRTIFQQSASSYEDFSGYLGDNAARELVLAVKSTFEDIQPFESA